MAGIATGCTSGSSQSKSTRQASELPNWVKDVREPLQEFPEQSENSYASGDTDRRDRVGEPTALGERLNATSSQRARSRTAQTSAGESNSSATVDIDFPDAFTLNVNTAGDSALVSDEPVLPSALELQYRGDLPAQPDRELEQFGYEQLARLSTPVGAVDGASSPDHVLVAGDEIIVDLTTDRVQRFRARVDEDGTLELEGLVSPRVGGVRFADAQALIRREIERVRRDFDLSVGLGRLASVPVRVVGEVSVPGVIELGARPSLLDAIGSAGVLKSGSLRRITLRRASGEVIQVDLYSYLLGNGPAPDLRLTRGDTITVPPIGATVGVAGSVQRPGIYELLKSQSLTPTDAVAIAGGSTGFAVSNQVQVERTQGNRRVLLDIELANKEEGLLDGDLVLVGAVDGRLHPVVEVVGEVARAGRFQHRTGMSVGDLIRMSGGLTVDADDRQALLSRVSGVAGDRAVAWDAQTIRTSRRVLVIDLSKALHGDPEHDVTLEPLDHIRVRSMSETRAIPTVEVMGGVRRPGTYELTAGLTVRDVLVLAGNLEPDAFREEAELVRRKRTADASLLDVDRYRIDLGAVLRGETPGPQLRAGDRLIVRKLSRAEVRVTASGMVRFPGEYVLPAGSRITDLIAAAGGLLNDADLRASRFTRSSVRDAQRDRWGDLEERTRQWYEHNLEERVNSARAKEAFAARIQLQQVQETLSRLRTVQATGRIVVPFTRDDFPESDANLVLESGDAIDVPRASHTVSVQGHVFNPSTEIFFDEVTADWLLERAGGVTEFADTDRLYVVRADGRVASVEQSKGRFRLTDPLLPGDIVLVPSKPLGRDAGSVMLDLLLLARAAGEAGALWNLASSDIDDGSVSIIDSPASPRNDSVPPSELLREFQR